MKRFDKFLILLGIILVIIFFVRLEAQNQKWKEPVRVLDEVSWKVAMDNSIPLTDSINDKIKVVVFYNYLCPWCKKFEDTLSALPDSVKNKIDIRYKHSMRSYIGDEFQAAISAECAYSQHRFSQYHRLVFSKYDSIGIISWKEFARLAGVQNTDEFLLCLKDQHIKQRVIDSNKDAIFLDIKGTPTFIIDGSVYQGAISSKRLVTLLLEPKQHVLRVYGIKTK